MDKSKYTYTEGQQEINRAFKMQEKELHDLKESSSVLEDSISQTKESLSEVKNDAEELSSKTDMLIQRAMNLAKARGINANEQETTPYGEIVERRTNEPCLADIPISQSEIPSWEEIMRKTDEMVSEQVALEELLSAEEFQYCIDDVKRINEAFARKTRLNKVDLSFLLVATALQTARWIIIQTVCGDLGQRIDPDTRLAHNDKSIKDSVLESNKKFQGKFEGHGHKPSNKSYKSWEQIIFSSAPYDTAVGARQFGENLEGGYHRYKTLGHDPILGWIFGTANFITDTCTLSNFNSYRIERKGRPHFASQTDLRTIFYEVFDSVREDWLRLPAGIFAEFVHLKSDAFTKLGLPVPVLEVFSEDLAGKLYRSQYDSLCLLRDMKIVGNQAAWSILINMIIGLVHGLFYNQEKDGQREHYEVRTRKILLYSNAISTSINLAYVGVNASYGNVGEALRKLDLGGLLVTLYRLFSDVRFITKVKEQFINEELDNVTRDALADLDAMFAQ